MTINILTAILHTEDEMALPYWQCWLELEQLGQVWMLPTTATGNLAENELQAHFDVRESELWQVASVKQYVPDVYAHIEPKQILKAFAGVLLDELNVLRQQHGLQPRTLEQLRDAIKAKL